MAIRLLIRSLYRISTNISHSVFSVKLASLMMLYSLHLKKKTQEALFAKRLLSRMRRLKMAHHRYQHMDIFLGESLGAVALAGNDSFLNASYAVRNMEVLATGVVSEGGEIAVDTITGKSVKLLENVDHVDFCDTFVNLLSDEKGSAVVGSFREQRRVWSSP